MIKNNFYKDKTILITGATGSIGKSLVLKLLKTNCKTVRALTVLQFVFKSFNTNDFPIEPVAPVINIVLSL